MTGQCNMSLVRAVMMESISEQKQFGASSVCFQCFFELCVTCGKILKMDVVTDRLQLPDSF